MSDSEEEDDMIAGDDVNDWVDEDDNVARDCVACLFCTDRFSNANDTFIHCREVHEFDIAEVRARLQLDCFTYIKLINYIRLQGCTASSLSSYSHYAVPALELPWISDDFMKPVLEDDQLLYFDIESLSAELLNRGSSLADKSPKMCAENSGAAGVVTLSTADYNELMLRLQVAETQSTHAQEAFANALSDIETLRSAAREAMLSTNDEYVVQPSGDDAIARLCVEDDQLYIESYSHFSIHEEMLKDSVRTGSYQDAIYRNEAIFKDRVVLDVGCGLGILSMFAAKAGARLVIGVDQSEIIFQAMDVIRENGFQEKIKLIHGKMEEVQLPVEKVDIIISEWMGYFLLYESMLDTVLWARNQYLNKDGLVLPDRCTLNLLGVHDNAMYASRVEFWDDVSGFRMSSMKSVVTAETDICLVDKEKIITDVAVLKTIDTQTCLYKDLDFTSDFTLTARRPGFITSLVGYFDVDFCCTSKVSFSTGPESSPTHWKQTVFLLEKPLPVNEGMCIAGQIMVKKNNKDPRCLIIKITLNDRTRIYQMQ